MCKKEDLTCPCTRVAILGWLLLRIIHWAAPPHSGMIWDHRIASATSH